MLQRDSSGNGPTVSTVTRSLLPRVSDGYAQQTRKLERTLGWVLWLGFAAVLLLTSM